MLSAVENNNVRNVYQDIAHHFNNTRVYKWSWVVDFLNKFGDNNLILDLGCGNGRNMVHNNIKFIGIDNCDKFINICKGKGLEVYNSNITRINLKSELADGIICIAVFHHLATDVRRVKAMSEMIRILKPGGKGICSMWSFEQIERKNNMKMREFVLGDNYVPWMRKGDDKVFTRYYYIFNETMIKQWIQQFEPLICIERVFNERGNWVIEFTKK